MHDGAYKYPRPYSVRYRLANGTMAVHGFEPALLRPLQLDDKVVKVDNNKKGVQRQNQNSSRREQSFGKLACSEVPSIGDRDEKRY